MRWFLFLLTILLSTVVMNAQSFDTTVYSLHITPRESEIIIDGVLDEPAWLAASQLDSFWQHSPVDDLRSSHETTVYVTYDEKQIYVGAICYDTSDYYVRSLKRDDWSVSDEFGVIIDPIGEKALGYGFSTNVLGGETEGLISAPGNGTGTWDNRWTSAVTRLEDRYIVEIAIPFKSLRFKAGDNNWRIQFLRIDPDKNEIQSWAPIPRQFSMFDLGYMGTLHFSEPPKKQGGNVVLIPYATATFSKISNDGNPADVKGDIGGDAKIALTSSLNLDLTTNPDFSQVEVDEQVTNLNRFGIFFPERRQFFIENDDIFNSLNTQFGGEQPFYSRRIGLDESGRTVPILYGARVTGNLNSGLRIGAFNIHQQESVSRLGQNYSAATFQQRIGHRSFIKGLFLNRQGYIGSDQIKLNYGRNLGGEFDRLTNDGIWRFRAGGIHSFKEGFSSKDNHLFGSIAYAGQRFRTTLEFQHMGENYFSDMGFTGRLEQYNPVNDEVVRIGFTQVSSNIDYYTYPADSKDVDYQWSGAENYVYLNTDGSLNEWYTRLRHFWFYKNTSVLRFRFNYNYVDLIYPFALTEVPLPAQVYNMTELNVQYNSDIRNRVSGEIFVVYGQFFSGTKLTARVSASLRKQPWGTFAIGIEQNNIVLPDPYGKLELTLATGRIEINFRKNLFWTTFLQYNTQANNFNVNSRLQWRFAPVSDLYLVYTDNYRVEPSFGPKDKTLVLKMNYWLSL